MARGFVYLTAVVDWASRKILAHQVAITLEAMNRPGFELPPKSWTTTLGDFMAMIRLGFQDHSES